MQLQRVNFLLRLWEAPEAIEVRWEERRRSMSRQGDYDAFVVSMELLRYEMPGRHSFVWRAVCYNQVDLDNLSRGLKQPTERSLAELNASLYWLAERMPRPIKVPHHLRVETRNVRRKKSLWHGRTEAHQVARAERDREIIHQRLELGWKLSRIARFHAIDERRVKQILAPITKGAS